MSILFNYIIELFKILKFKKVRVTALKYILLIKVVYFFSVSLHRHLIEHLNAEIVLHTITDVNIALEWIRSTLLYIRALKNPSHYGLLL